MSNIFNYIKKIILKNNKNNINIENEIDDIVTSNILNCNSDEEFKKYVTNNILMNKDVLEYFLNNYKDDIHYCKLFQITDFRNDDVYNATISKDDIITELKNSFNILDDWQINIYNKIKYYDSSEYLNNEILNRIIYENYTVKDILNYLNNNINIFEDKSIGITYEKLLNIVSDAPFYLRDKNKSIINKISISEEEKKNIENNFQKLRYEYEKDYVGEEKFSTHNSILNKFELDKALEQDITSKIPSNFSKIQKTYYIYKMLCRKFSYDVAYYYNECHPYDKLELPIDHFNIKRISKIKDSSDEVVCAEVMLIYAKFLEKLNIPLKIIDVNNNNVSKLDGTHMKVLFKADDYVISSDAVPSIIHSDLAMEKLYGKVDNFLLLNSTTRIKDRFDDEIETVNKYFKDNIYKNEINETEEINKKLHRSEDNISFNERINILIDLIMKQKNKYIDLFEWMYDITNYIFVDQIENCSTEFIINKKDYNKTKKLELSILITYNESADIYDNMRENKYIIIDSDKKYTNLSYEQVRYLFNTESYCFTEESRNIFNKVKKTNTKTK